MQKNGGGNEDGVMALEEGEPLRHAEAVGALTTMIRNAGAAATAAECRPETSARMELHLSGFFSMISSIIKPWTSAIRLGRVLLTPTAPGLFDERSCMPPDDAPRRRSMPSLSCHFEPIGPSACEPANPRLGRFLFNLPEMHRESLTASDGHMLPKRFRNLGAFWWVSQLTHRLLRPRRHLRAQLRLAARESGLAAALAARPRRPIIGLHVRHGDACVTSEKSRTVRSCEPLSVYMEAIQPYATAVGTSHIFIATDSEVVLADAARLYPQYKLLFMPNVTRSGLTNPVPTEILDELIKRRMRSGRGVQDTERHAIMGVLDALLLSRCDVLVGKFSSGLFRASYALAAARRGGALPPFVSLDAPWCADYGVPAGYNDAFPKRGGVSHVQHGVEQIDPDAGGDGKMRQGGKNVFLC